MIEKILKLQGEGLSQQAIGESLGLSRDQVYRLLKKHREREAGIEIDPHWDEEESVEDLWAAAEKRNNKAVRKAKNLCSFDVKVHGDLPIGISFISDQHISDGNSVDLSQMMSDAKLVAQTEGLYAVLGGDSIDNHIKHRAAILAARSQPDDQLKLFNHYLGAFEDSVMAGISGNHDAWTNQVAGFDAVNHFFKLNLMHFAPAEAYLRVKFDKQEYDVAIRHQYRLNSSFNQTHAPKQWFRNNPVPFDVGVVCHHHEPAVEHCLINGADRVFVRPGSYQITSAYSRQYGYNQTRPTCPTVVLYPGWREIVAFYDVRKAALFLEWERKRFANETR